MSWFQSLDIELFRFINLALSNPLFDRIMPFFSGNALFIPLVLALAATLAWKGNRRGRICLLMLVLVICLGDPLVINTLKHAFARARPFDVVPDAITLIGRSGSYGMPSAHAANWFAATVVLTAYFPRSVWFMLPLAVIVSFSRVYNGVHYPGDVLVGACLGASYAATLIVSLESLWRRAGRRWFPFWFGKLPSLRHPESALASPAEAIAQPPVNVHSAALDAHWLRFGYAFIALLLFVRLAYIASDEIELCEDEAYQWLWSKHLALSYYSKPPLIAWVQFLGTSIWGDSAFGVRFFSPVFAAVMSVILLRFLSRESNSRVGALLVCAAATTPLLAVGATLMTVDSLAVLFWIAALASGWRAVQGDSTRHWLWTGLWMGLGFLSKYTTPFHLLCWAVFFALWRPARAQLKRPGPCLALLLCALCTLPVFIWNARHDWITLTHLGERGGLDSQWRFTLRYFNDFVGAEFRLLNPVFVVMTVWASIAFWRRERNNPLMIYLFSMGAPVFLFYLACTLRARVHPNWIAVSVVPLFCLAAIYWDAQWRAGRSAVKGWLAAGLAAGLVAVVLLHDTNLVGKFAGRTLPVELDPLTRVRGWKTMAHSVGEARTRLLREGKPVFIIGNHYGITSLLTFYLPEARIAVPDHPLAYCRSSEKPENQFFFWPGYENRRGQNAIFVLKTESPQPPPKSILTRFARVTDRGIHPIQYRGRVFHQIQIFECRDLR